MIPRSCVVRVALALLLMCLVFAVSGPAQATVNCMTQQCVVIYYDGPVGGGAKDNKNCFIGAVSAYAFSTDAAFVMYGQDSVGGTQDARLDCAKIEVKQWSADCSGQTPTSGTVTMTNGDAFNSIVPTKCKLSD